MFDFFWIILIICQISEETMKIMKKNKKKKKIELPIFFIISISCQFSEDTIKIIKKWKKRSSQIFKFLNYLLIFFANFQRKQVK